MKTTFLKTFLVATIFTPLLVNAESFPVSESTSTASSTITETKEEVNYPTSTSSILNIFTKCQQSAIDKRDESIELSRDTYNHAISQARTLRKEGEKTVVAIQDEVKKKTTQKAVFEAYKENAKKAQKTLTEARKDAWSIFEEEKITCELEKEKSEKMLEDLANPNIGSEEGNLPDSFLSIEDEDVSNTEKKDGAWSFGEGIKAKIKEFLGDK